MLSIDITIFLLMNKDHSSLPIDFYFKLKRTKKYSLLNILI